MTLRWKRLCCAGALLLPLFAAQQAHAQYSWLDDHGTRVFSDQPPPPGTPANRILKAPRGAAPYVPEAAPAAAADAAPDKPGDAKAAAPKGPPTLAEREADFAKRAKERQQAEAKAAEQAQKAAATARQCAALRNNEAELAGGRRVTRINAAGEHEYVADDERERMLAEARKEAARCR